MKKPQLYFESEHEEICYTLEHFTDSMEETEQKFLFEAVPDSSTDYAWCKDLDTLIPKRSGICGTGCRAYEPRNGKSGACKHYSTNTYTKGVRIEVLIQNGQPVIKKLIVKEEDK